MEEEETGGRGGLVNDEGEEVEEKSVGVGGDGDDFQVVVRESHIYGDHLLLLGGREEGGGRRS